MKERGSFALRAGVVVCLTALLLAGMSVFLQRPENVSKDRVFYESEDTYDVLFFGSSHSCLGILPMELWKEYGITSYNLSNAAQWLSVDYWFLQDALKTQKPSLVVLDTYTTALDGQYAADYGEPHTILDEMPFSRLKWNAVWDIMEEDTRLEMMFPFSVYHNDWDSITERYFRERIEYQKGAYENSSIGIPDWVPVQEQETVTPQPENIIETSNTDYLRKCIELCQENEIQVLLLLTPFTYAEGEAVYTEFLMQQCEDAAYAIAAEYGVPLLDGIQERAIDPRTDYYDVGHLNASGARRWTDYVGGYCQEAFGLVDHREDASYSSWWTDYQDYMNWKLDSMKTAPELYSYMTALSDTDFNFYVWVEAETGLAEKESFWDMMESAGAVRRSPDDSEPYFCRIDHGTGQVQDNADGADASLQEAQWRIQECVQYAEESAVVHIYVEDKQTGEFLQDMHFRFP